MEADYLITMSQNCDAYMKHHDITYHKWMRVNLIIILKLHEWWPQPIALADFVDDQNSYAQITRAIKDLEDSCGFIRVETVNQHKKGRQPKYLYLTDKGLEFVAYINPE